VNCYTLIGLAADTHDPCSVQMLLRRLRPEVQVRRGPRRSVFG
jgi:hypothetical protein